QDGAADALRLRERPAAAVGRPERQPGRFTDALRPADAAAVEGEEGIAGGLLPVPQQDRHAEAGEEGRQADHDDDALARRQRLRADAQAAAEALWRHGAEGSPGAEGPGTHDRYLMRECEWLPRRNGSDRHLVLRHEVLPGRD